MQPEALSHVEGKAFGAGLAIYFIGVSKIFTREGIFIPRIEYVLSEALLHVKERRLMYDFYSGFIGGIKFLVPKRVCMAAGSLSHVKGKAFKTRECIYFIQIL